MKLIKKAELGGLLDAFANLVVITGAGVSTESGIPDFRSLHGLYRDRKVVKMMTLDGFNSDPVAFYKKMAPMWKTMKAARPNDAHKAIADWEKRRSVTVVTQNVDGLHQAAGSSNVLEIHGHLSTMSCQDCGGVFETKLFSRLLSRGLAPRCPSCGAVLRPDFVFFDEYLDDGVYGKAAEAIENADAVVVAGTSLSLDSTIALIEHKACSAPLYRLFKGYVNLLNPFNHRFDNEMDIVGCATDILPMIA